MTRCRFRPVGAPTTSALLALMTCAAIAGCSANDGADGAPGSTVELRDLEPGATCAHGGVEIRTGVDTDGNGVIEDGELGASRAVCNGSDATTSAPLVHLVTLDPGATCTAGGVLVTFGFDGDGDGLIDTVEQELPVCNGLQGQDGQDGTDGRTLLVEAGSTAPTCPDGGATLTFGYDTVGDGAIDDVLTVQQLCNGAQGAQGDPGATGDAAILDVQTLAAGEGGCPNGGVQVTYGISGSPTSSVSICNGVDGQDGAPAPAGGGAILVDATDQELGTIIGSLPLGFTIMTSAGYRVTMSIEGEPVAPRTMTFSGADCTGSAAVDLYQVTDTRTWGRDLYYRAASDQLYRITNVDPATGMGVVTNIPYASYLAPNGACTNVSGTDPGIALTPITRAEAGLPDPITGPLSVQ